MPLFQKIPVRLGATRYEVLIGCHHLHGLARRIRQLQLGTHPILLTNPLVLRSHGRAVVRDLLQGGFPVKIITIADTERSKSMSVLSRVLTRLAAWDGPGRRLFLVLVGGGVVGDLGGLAAGLYRRGIPYIQIPTTLLAQADSSIGGKTGVDLPQGKNLAGLIVQPGLVFVDVAFFGSLTQRQFRSGLAEIIKCGIVQDAALFSFLERTSISRLRRSDRLLGWLVARAVRVKASVVERDERDSKGIRVVLNLGHTLGHAIEAASHFSGDYTHGEAISVGMCAAAEVARRMGLLHAAAANRIENLLRRVGLPTTLRGVGLQQITKAMAHDKKWAQGAHRWVLPTWIGRVAIVDGISQMLVKKVVAGLIKKR